MHLYSNKVYWIVMFSDGFLEWKVTFLWLLLVYNNDLYGKLQSMSLITIYNVLQYVCISLCATVSSLFMS